ncbi:MAG: hypothetical protein ACRBM6_34305 [Geminicoccales bacterium]
MPIRPELLGFYPIDWPQLSDTIRFERAKGRCEQCARPHGKLISHLGDGRWFDPGCENWRDGQGRAVEWVDYRDYSGMVQQTKVYLATAHLNHDVADNRAKNLKALCQRCHMLHDREEHRRRRRLTWRRRRALGDLFEGPYRPW